MPLTPDTNQKRDLRAALFLCYDGCHMDARDFTVDTVVAAGALVLRLREEKFETTQKGGDPKDLVTSIDFEVNDFITQKLKETFPEDAIYSEETVGSFQEAPRLWAIDPIDGSSNFSRGIPHFAICLALLTNGVPEAGAVYNPVTRECFSFKRGSGAFLNGKPIHVSSIEELNDSFVLFHAGRKPEARAWGGRGYEALLGSAKKTSNLAGSALDTCFVAAGRVEANIYGTGTTLDMAAAIGCLTEAGGIIVNEDGETAPLLPTPQRIIVTNNKKIADAVRAIL